GRLGLALRLLLYGSKRTSVPRSACRYRRQARQLNLAGFSFAFDGRNDLLNVFFRPMLLPRARRCKSGRPSLLKPSLKVERDAAHTQNSGFMVAPVSRDLNARRPLKVHP